MLSVTVCALGRDLACFILRKANARETVQEDSLLKVGVLTLVQARMAYFLTSHWQTAQ